MPVSSYLIENGRIVHTKMTDPWTVEETLDVISQQNFPGQAHSHNMYLLIDLSESRQYPANVLRLRDTPALSPVKRWQARTIIVSSDLRVQGLFEVFERMRGIRPEYVTTFDEGLTMLRAVIAAEDAAS